MTRTEAEKIESIMTHMAQTLDGMDEQEVTAILADIGVSVIMTISLNMGINKKGVKALCKIITKMTLRAYERSSDAKTKSIRVLQGNELKERVLS